MKPSLKYGMIFLAISALVVGLATQTSYSHVAGSLRPHDSSNEPTHDGIFDQTQRTYSHDKCTLIKDGQKTEAEMHYLDVDGNGVHDHDKSERLVCLYTASG